MSLSMSGGKEKPVSFLDDFASDVKLLGIICMETYKKLNPNACDSYEFENLRKSVGRLESIGSMEQSTAKKSETLFNNNYSPQRTEVKPNNRWSNYKRVQCTQCDKRVLEIFLAKHLRTHLKQNASRSDKPACNSEDVGSSENIFGKINFDETSSSTLQNIPKISTEQRPFQTHSFNALKNKFSKYNRVSCSMCYKSILECFFPKHLRWHKKISQGSNATLNCALCDEVVDKKDVYQHMTIAHGTSDGSLTFQKRAEPPGQRCTLCDKTFLKLGPHMWGKHGVRGKIGDKKNSADATPKPMQRYAPVGEKVVVCFICKKPKTPYTIEKHFLKVHCNNDADKRFQLGPEINASENNSDDSDYDPGTHAQRSYPIRCTICAEFVSATQFNNHMKIEHDGAGFRYKCSLCDAGFMRLRGCRVHISHKHKNSNAKPLFLSRSLKSEIETGDDNTT